MAVVICTECGNRRTVKYNPRRVITFHLDKVKKTMLCSECYKKKEKKECM